MAKRILSLCLASLMMLLTGCGGSSETAPLPVNKAVVLSAQLSTGLVKTSVPIKIIEMSFSLPASVAISHTNGSLTIGETELKNLNKNGILQAGSYDPATRLVQITLWASDITNGDLGSGDIVRLTFTGGDLAGQDIKPVYKAYGLNVNNTSPDISAEITPSVSIITYQKP
jgi:hypothetical protein